MHLAWVSPGPQVQHRTQTSYDFLFEVGVAHNPTRHNAGKYVENLGGEKTGDLESVKGSGVGEARFAFLILLFIVVGKFRSAGLEVVPTIAGFFTYQLASLSQGLRQEADE